MSSDARSAGAARAISFETAPGQPIVRLSWTERAVALLLCLILFGAHLAFGGSRRDIALGLAAIEAFALAVLLISCAWARRQLETIQMLKWPAILFAGVLIIGLWSTTPFGLGGPHPIWSYVPATPASAVDKSAVLVELLRLLSLACLFATAWLVGADDDRARWFLRLLVGFSAVFAAWAFVSHALDPGVLFGSIPLPYGGERLSAAFLSANTAATYFGVSLLICACALTDGLRGRLLSPRVWSGSGLLHSAPAAVGAAFSVLCLFLTASRAGVAATALALVLFLGWEAVARRWKLLGPPGAALAGVAVLAGALLFARGAPLLDRISTAGTEFSGRRDLLVAHWQAFVASPWLGYGLGSFDAVNRMTMTSQNYHHVWNVHAAHNLYLQWLEEAGVLGAAAMFASVGLLLVMSARGAGRRTRMTTWIRGLIAAAMVPLLHGASDFAMQVPSITALFTCCLGLAAGLALRTRAVRG